MTHKEAITKFIQDHYPALKDIEISDIQLYITNDMIFNRPIGKTQYYPDGKDDEETDGIIVTFTSKNKIPIKDLANFCNILCHGVAWCVLPDYGGCDISEFEETLNGELDTCWHHTQITKVTDSYSTQYIIEQGFCMCS